MRVDGGRRSALSGLALGLVACAAVGCPAPVTSSLPPPAPTPTATPHPNPLELATDGLEAKSEKVRARLAASPHNYFRGVNMQFAQEVCRRFDKVMATLPMVNLHGDAHVEQFAVTEDSAGLADFDDSVTGPAVIDLARFGTSIELAARQRGWRSAHLLAAFLDSYDAALDDPSKVELPSIVGRIRQGFAKSHEAFLTWAESRMEPPPESERAHAEGEYARYVKLMLLVHPDKNEAFFGLKRWGMLRGQGIGSATTKRFLLRVEGPGPDADDDIILEAKEVRDLSAVPCVEARRGSGLRVVAGSVRFGNQPDPFLAVIPRSADESLDDPPWWIQSWSSNYAELDIQSSLEAEHDLLEVVTLVGRQMAYGHTNLLPAPYDLQLRQLVRQMLVERRDDIEQTITAMAALSEQAHQRWKQRLLAASPPVGG